MRRSNAGALLAALMLAAGLSGAAAQETTTIRAAVLDARPEPELPLSRLDLPPEDHGIAGARLATEDNATTGRFMGLAFELEERRVEPAEAVAALGELEAAGAHVVVTFAVADTLLALGEAAGPDTVLLNALAEDDRLRTGACRANILHVAPSRAMLTDALAQFLMVKRWDEWLLIHGSNPPDRLLAEAYRRAATKFGAEIVEEREFEDVGGARRGDSSHVLVQKQIPVFTQEAEDHDVIVAADESQYFAGHLPYHTWDASLVAGSAGLRPTTWHPGMEAWGGTQFQTRFEKLAGRPARPLDFQAWMALRALGEAAIRTRTADPAELRAYMLGGEFELAAFKGQPLTFRPWNQQLRQPILLTHDKLLVSVSPQEQYLHQRSRLDTLGYDAPESDCALN
jgi:ABC transporter substrate binding protein (PQQ-dependent alcohol dehydrogenase system)